MSQRLIIFINYSSINYFCLYGTFCDHNCPRVTSRSRFDKPVIRKGQQSMKNVMLKKYTKNLSDVSRCSVFFCSENIWAPILGLNLRNLFGFISILVHFMLFNLGFMPEKCQKTSQLRYTTQLPHKKIFCFNCVHKSIWTFLSCFCK